MAYGLQNTAFDDFTKYGFKGAPSLNAPAQGYENTAEDYLQQAGRAFQNPYAGQFSGLGSSLLGQYYGGTVPAMNRAYQASLYKPNLVSQAAVDAQMATDSATGSLKRNLGRMGINPNSGRFAGLLQEADLAGAAQKAGAMTRAEHMERQSQFGNLMSAAGLGQNLPSLAMSAFGQARPNAGSLLGLAGDYGSLAGGAARLQANQNNPQTALLPANNDAWGRINAGAIDPRFVNSGGLLGYGNDGASVSGPTYDMTQDENDIWSL